MFCPEKREEPEVPKSPEVYFLSPKVGAEVLPNMDPEVLPKLKAGFYLCSGFYFLSTETPEKRPPLNAGFLSSSFGVLAAEVPLKRPDEEGVGLVFANNDPVLFPNNGPVFCLFYYLF